MKEYTCKSCGGKTTDRARYENHIKNNVQCRDRHIEKLKEEKLEKEKEERG